MSFTIGYNQALNQFSDICDRVVAEKNFVILERGDRENVAVISAKELSSLLETLHLLKSPKNATRLFEALEEADSRTVLPKTLNQLKQEVGLGIARETVVANTKKIFQ
ncbi:MAG: type II toxin-antitoxin system Phd/YefM family antitoxin [Pseudanabaena sp.]|jgi:antitoxin YefM